MKLTNLALVQALSLALVAPVAQAQLRVKAEGEVTGSIWIKHHSNKRGGSCGGGPGPTYQLGTSLFKTPFDLYMPSEGQVDFGVGTDVVAKRSYAIALKNSQKKLNGTVEALFSVSEESTESMARSWRDGCEHNHWVQVLKAAGYAMTLTVEYEVPANTWILEIDEKVDNTIFQAVDPEALKNSLADISKWGKRFVWVKPGEKLNRRFVIRPAWNKQRSKGEYFISVRPIGQTMKVEDIRELIVTNHQASQKDASKLEELIKIVEENSSLLNSPNLREALLASSTAHLNKMSEKLFKDAITREIKGVSAHQILALKLSSAFLLYQVAVAQIDRLSSLCDEIEVNLPFLKEKARVRGWVYGVFILERMLNRLDPNNLGPYQAVIDNLKSFENQGLTYSQVMRDEKLRQPLQQALALWRRSVRPGRRPFGGAYQDVLDYTSNFEKTVEVAPLIEAGLHDLRELGKVEDSMVRQMNLHLNEYGVENQNKISVTELTNTLQQMEKHFTDSRSKLLHAIPALNADSPNLGAKEGLNTLFNNVAFNIMPIFQDRPEKLKEDEDHWSARFKSVDLDPSYANEEDRKKARSHYEQMRKVNPHFEAVRLAYVDKNKTEAVLNKVKACTGQGGN